MRKILSVIIPTYNVEKYLDRCLISLLSDNKTNELIELLIVNDGSKDKSLEIAKAFEHDYPETVKVIDKENGGHGSTINVGLSKATGKYLRVIDSDDWVNIEDFPKYVNELTKTDADLIITNYRREYVYNGSSEFFTYNEMLEANKEYIFDKFDNKLLGTDYFFMATSTFKTSLLKKSNLYLDEKTFYVDMEFIIFSIMYVKTFVYWDYDIYRYYIGRPEQSVNLSNFVKNRDHHTKVTKRLVKYYEDTKMSKVKKEYIAKILVLLLNTHYSIYCDMKVPKNARRDIKNFDTFLKNTSNDLYEKSNKGFIKANRKTNFIFCQSPKNIFSELAIKYSRKD